MNYIISTHILQNIIKLYQQHNRKKNKEERWSQLIFFLLSTQNEEIMLLSNFDLLYLYIKFFFISISISFCCWKRELILVRYFIFFFILFSFLVFCFSSTNSCLFMFWITHLFVWVFVCFVYREIFIFYSILSLLCYISGTTKF